MECKGISTPEEILAAVTRSRMEQEERTRTKDIAARVVGHRTIAGTDWPIIDKIERQEFNGKVEWVVVRGLCNGVPRGHVVFRSKRKALIEFG
jgi:hypothetical protein